MGKLSLCVFECQHCGFASFPIDALRHHPNLEILKLRENERFVLNLAEVLHHLPKLKFLDLGKQKRMDITGLNSLTHTALTTLNLAGNDQILHRILANFSGLINLRVLKLSGCMSGPFSMHYLIVRNMAKLETLDFSFNSAFVTRETERVLQGLPNLKTLYLRSNYIRKNNLASLLRPVADTLERLDISDNKIEYLNKSTFTLTKRVFGYLAIIV